MPSFVCEERLAFGPWAAFERMLLRLIQHAGYDDVSLVGGPGDEGADIVGTMNGQRWVIQAKYRASGGAGASAVKEAVRAMRSYGASVAVGATNTYFTQEVYSYIQEAKRNGLDTRAWNGATLLKYSHALPTSSRAKRVLRAYQATAVDSIEGQRRDGAQRTLLIMATGLGKSVVASEVVQHELDRNPSQEVLVLAHTRDLVRQLEASFWPQLSKEHSTHLWTDGEEPSYSGGVVFAHLAIYRRCNPPWEAIY